MTPVLRLVEELVERFLLDIRQQEGLEAAVGLVGGRSDRIRRSVVSDGGVTGRRKLPIGGLVIVNRQSQLLEVVGARHSVRCLAHFLHRRHQQADQDGDDGDDDKQLNEGESGSTGVWHGIT